MATGKIVFLLVLLAISVALSYAKLWMERRRRAAADNPIGEAALGAPPAVSMQTRALAEFQPTTWPWDINLRWHPEHHRAR